MGKNGTAEVKPIEWKSISKGAPEYTSRTRAQVKAAITNAKFANIFTPENVRETQYHPDFPPVAEVTTSALDQWLAYAPAPHGRATRNGQARRYHVGIPDSISADVKAALEPFMAQGLTIETAYKPRTKVETPDNGAHETNAELFEQDLVEA